MFLFLEPKTPLQIKLNELSKILSVMVLVICGVIFAINIIRNLSTGQGLNGEFFINTFMVAISLAVAAIPEGLAAVVTVLLSIGVTKMSKNKAIIRKLTAVETLGCTEIICSDKTGTLTQNKMTVVQHVTVDTGSTDVTDDGKLITYYRNYAHGLDDAVPAYISKALVDEELGLVVCTECMCDYKGTIKNAVSGPNLAPSRKEQEDALYGAI